MSERIKLLPCPFCNDTYIRVHYTKGGNYVVGCNTVNCVACHTEGKLYKTEKEAIEAWNRRAPVKDEYEVYG